MRCSSPAGTEVQSRAYPSQPFLFCPSLLCLPTSLPSSHPIPNHQKQKHSKKKETNSQPGVLALGYVKITTPLVLFSSNSFTVTLFPSCVWTVPPKLSRSLIVVPSLSFSAVAFLFPPFVATGADVAGAAEAGVSVARGLGSVGFEEVTAALALSASFLILEL
jgi:hypothetical protein